MPNTAWSNGIKANVVNTLDTSKIQKLAKQANVNIMVGVKSGTMHQITPHKNKEGKYKGYNGEDVSDIKPIDMAELAKALHFGTATIPARPFLEDGVRSKQKELTEAMAGEVQKLKEGGQANWNKIGTMAVGGIVDLISSDYYKTRIPNSKKTIDYKGSDKPLVDTGELKNSITFLVNGVEQK